MPDRGGREPLLSYLRVQEAFERDLLAELRRAASDVDRELRKLADAETISGRIKRDQLLRTKAALRRRMGELWRLVGSTVQARRNDAAAAAAEAQVSATRSMLERAGLTARQIRTMEASLDATARRGIESTISRMTLSRKPLSTRVYRSQQLIEGRIDRIINSHLARGSSARAIAQDVRAFVRPDTPGGVRYAAQRLGRTELNNAFHATQVRLANDSPFVEAMKWNLSGSHPRPDECNDYADDDHEGKGAGVFSATAVPGKPHPNCLCFCTYVTPDFNQFLASFRRGDYDRYIDKQMGR